MSETEANLELWDRKNPPALTLRRRAGIKSVAEIRRVLLGLKTETAPARRQAALGLALLWHDHWTESHLVAQEVEGDADFDLLHGVVHRREGDYANAAYWFRAAKNHPVFGLLGAKLSANPVSEKSWTRRILSRGVFNPQRFLTCVQEQPDLPFFTEVQTEEFLTFFEFLMPDLGSEIQIKKPS